MHVDAKNGAKLASRTIKYDINVYFRRLCALNVNDRNTFGIFKTDENEKKWELGTGEKTGRARMSTEIPGFLLFVVLFRAWEFELQENAPE